MVTQPTFKPSPKLELPRFDGIDPKGWMIKADQYFEFINMEESRKVKLAGLHFEGRAVVWFRFYMVGQGLVDWKVFTNDLVVRFKNPKNRDIQDLFINSGRLARLWTMRISLKN